MSGVELNVLDEDKEQLRCAVCEGYLMCSPIRMLNDGSNICGRCTPADKDTPTYRNIALEAVLKGAVFPCKFKHQGCTKRLHFIWDSNHESTCCYNVTKDAASTEAVGNSAHTTTAIKLSESMCEQEQPVASTSREPNQMPVTKAWSQCTDDSARDKNWQDNPDRNASEPMPGGPNYDTMHPGRASSVASNEYRRQWQTRRQPQFFRPRPYDNFVRNQNYPQSPWIRDRQAEHINMYKRRNNLIIIKGGTFYVNW